MDVVGEDTEMWHAYYNDDEEATRRRQHRWEARELTEALLEHVRPLTARRESGEVIYSDEVRDAQAMRGTALRAFLRAKFPPKYPMPATQRDLDVAQEELQELHRYAIQRPVTAPVQVHALPLPRSIQMLLGPEPDALPAPAPAPAPAPYPGAEEVANAFMENEWRAMWRDGSLGMPGPVPPPVHVDGLRHLASRELAAQNATPPAPAQAPLPEALVELERQPPPVPAEDDGGWAASKVRIFCEARVSKNDGPYAMALSYGLNHTKDASLSFADYMQHAAWAKREPHTYKEAIRAALRPDTNSKRTPHSLQIEAIALHIRMHRFTRPVLEAACASLPAYAKASWRQPR
jgi:hypothetical protein